MALFDADVQRVDASPLHHAESVFAFLNRVRSQFFGNVRTLMEDWLDAFPAAGHADIRGRLRSGENRQLLGAFWELWLYAVHTRLGFTLTPHPELPGVSTRPDFLVEAASGVFLLEATVATSSDQDVAADRRRRQVYETLDSVESPNFFLWVDVEEDGLGAPPAARLRPRLEEWVSGLDPDDIGAGMDETGDLRTLPALLWEMSGWKMTFRAIPKKPEARGRDDVRPLGMFTEGGAKWMDTGGPVLRALSEKAGRYGRLDLPYLVAVLAEGPFVSDYSINRALFGRDAMRFGQDGESTAFKRPDGLWYGPRGLQNTRVSAVLSAIRLEPWTAATVEPVLWLNPWAERPLEVELPWETRRMDLEAGQLTVQPATLKTRDVLALPEGWPGPDDLDDA